MARLPRIPDLLTTANLCCGVGSILLASQGQLTIACWLVFAGAAFDVLDGLAARALGGGSELGKQLDSLADMVTFGVAPGMLVYMIAATSYEWTAGIPELDIPAQNFGSIGILLMRDLPLHVQALMAATPLVLTIASAWRLAKFNLDTRQTSGFLGLPTPANALFWAAMVLASQRIALDGGLGAATMLRTVNGLLASPSALFAASFAMAILMVSELPLPSLKFSHFGWRGNQVIYLLGGAGVVLVVLYGILAVPMIMVLYILSPLWGRMFPKGA